MEASGTLWLEEGEELLLEVGGEADEERQPPQRLFANRGDERAVEGGAQPAEDAGLVEDRLLFIIVLIVPVPAGDNGLRRPHGDARGAKLGVAAPAAHLMAARLMARTTAAYAFCSMRHALLDLT